jgi:predicted PurR-regulated permease PerM
VTFGKWIGFISLLFSVYILWQIRQILLLLFMAVVLADALNLLVKCLQRWRIKRAHAVILAMILLLGVIVGSVWLIVPPLVEQIQQLVTLVPEGIEKLIIRLTAVVSRLDPELTSIWPSLNNLVAELQPVIREIVNRGLSVFYSSLGTVLSLLLLLALTVMFLTDPQPYRQGLIRLFPSFYRRRVDTILTLCDRALCGWLTTIMFHMGIMLLLSWLGLSLLKIPLAFSQAFLSGFLTFIPNLGPILAMIAPIAIALLEQSWKPWAVILLYSIIYIIIQQLDNYLLVPRVLKQHISLISGVTLLAQIFFAVQFGFLGLFLAFPLLIIVQIWIQELLINDVLEPWDLNKNQKLKT